jgi:hypothetical protein
VLKLTNGEIFAAVEPLKRLMGQKFPIKTSLALSKLVHKLDDELKVINEVRQGLFQKYGTKEPEGLMVKADNPNREKFYAEHAELMAQETEVVLEKVKLPESVEIEAADMMLLEKFIEVA